MSKIVPKETREATTLDAMRAHALDGKPLPARLQQRFDHLGEIWKLVRLNGRANGVKLFAKRNSLNVTSCYPILNQAMQLYGQVLTNDKEGERQMLLDRLDQVWRKAMKADDLQAANKAMELRMKLLKLDSEDDAPPPRPMVSTIIFTIDPSVLNEKQQTEDRPYESA